MAEDPPRRNTLRMGAMLDEKRAEPDAERRAPHPATIARAAPQRYVLLGDAPSRRKSRQTEPPVSEDPSELYEELAPHLSWLREERRPELRRLLLRGELTRVLERFDEEHERFPKNVSVEKCQKIIERALTRRLVQRLEPSERVPVLTGEVSSRRPRDPRVIVADRVDGSATVDEILRNLPMPRLAGLLAFDDLLSQGVIAYKPRAERPVTSRPPAYAKTIRPIEPEVEEDPPVSGRPTLADPIESEAMAARMLPAPRPTPPEEELTSEEEEKPQPEPDEPGKAVERRTRPPAPSAPKTETASALASVPPRASVAPTDASRRLVTALVGTTGAAIGIAVVAIVFATRPTATPTASPSAPGPERAAPASTQQAASSTAATSTAQAPAAPEPASMTLKIEVSPDYARVYLDGARLKPPLERTLPRDGADHELRIEAPGHKTRKIPFKANADLALVVALEALPKKKSAPTNEDIY